ncbi:fimbrial protein [Enterobacter sp.]|uniref:fimbrial protein n=1 Tax=Enterobacter sp. TaxID=42895 RepID=UPI00296FAE4E|nr:fimbrial protein [Enterobacter sp.]
MLIRMLFSVALLLLASSAQAACSSTPPTPQTWDFGMLEVTTALPVGSVIPGSEHTFSFNGQCDSDGQEKPGDVITACFYGLGAEISTMPGVYATGIRGVGIALTNSAGMRVRGHFQQCDSRATPLTSLNDAEAFQFSLTLSLIKTDTRVRGGTLNPNQTRYGLMVYRKSGIGGTSPYVSYQASIKEHITGCDVNTRNLDVKLGRHPLQHFSSRAKGGVTPAVPFTIDLNCEEGAKVSLSLNGTEDPSLTPGVLALTDGATRADGVGVQLVTPQMQPVPLNTMQTVIPAAHEGLVTLPFFARYYLTSATPGPGPANATATFTVVYE